MVQITPNYIPHMETLQRLAICSDYCLYKLAKREGFSLPAGNAGMIIKAT
jgi:hypothetical protein